MLVRTWAQRCAYAVRAFSNIQHGYDVVGIDFGTTNSRLAIMEAQVPTILESESGQATPSFVTIDCEKKILVGQLAKCHAIAYPADGLFNIRTLLGKKFHDSEIQELKNKVPYKIIEGSDGEVWVEACNEQFSPTRVCAFIIGKMKKLAESYLMRSVSKAVIAAPVYFSDAQRKEIELAGRIAGLDVLAIVDEPIAAALSCKNIDSGIVAVLNLGGGTFNISVLKISEGDIEVKGKEFDTSLGGEEFDLALVEYLVEEIRKFYSVDISEDRIAMMRLKEAAEKAKLELSSSHQALISLCYLTASEFGAVHANITLSRPKFDELVERLVQRTKELCQKCLKSAHVNEREIDEVIVVGGMARVPRLQQIVREFFMKSPCMQVNPEEAVAIGAVLRGALTIEDERKLSPDLIPLSLGIETLGGGFARIINRHSVIPCIASQKISTACDNQDSISVRILQGENGIASRNKLLGELKVTGLPPAPQGVPSVKLEFRVHINGVLTVLAKSKDTDIEKFIEFQYLDEISEDYVKMMVKKAILCGRRNLEKSAVTQIRSMAALRINRIEKIMSIKRKVMPWDLMCLRQSTLAGYKKALDSEDVVLLKSLVVAAARLEHDLSLINPDDMDGDESDDF